MKRFGIHIRLLFAVFTLICATTFSLGYMGVNITRRFVQTRFEERISFLARYLALSAELGILIDDRAMLKRLTGNILSEKDVAGVAVLDVSGHELAGVSRELPGPLFVVEKEVVLKESEEESTAFDWKPGKGQGEKNLIGKVRIIYGTEGINRLLVAIRDRFIWLSAGLACLAGVIFYFLSRSLVAPVTELAGAARQVALGDLDSRVRPRSLPETRELAQAFNAMLDSLARSRKALEEANEEMMKQYSLAEMGKFSLMIAHEIKNPLSIIKSSLDVLKKDTALSPDNIMVLYMEDEIRRLNRLIEDFLSFARPDRPSFRDTDINALISDIVMKFQLQKSEAAVEIRSHIPTGPCRAHVDPDLLTRAIGNILRNAAEANCDQGVIHITIAGKDSKIIVDIADEGEGIDPDNINRIFEPFFTTRSKGTGLGLAYVFQVIRAHNGVVSAKNREDGGTLFRVEIPV